ncbi:Spastin [Arthrobotrys entomopaga]|nr:Spastin [Arthrobotrys entomopaga]
MQIAKRRALHLVLRSSRNSPLLTRSHAIYNSSSFLLSPSSSPSSRSTYICSRCSSLHISAKRQHSPSSDHAAAPTAAAGAAGAATAESSKVDLPSSSPAEESAAADDVPASAQGEVSFAPELVSSNGSPTSTPRTTTTTGGDGTDPDQPDKRPASRTTTTRRTTKRTTKQKEEPLPKIDLPEWFLERAVFLPEELEGRESNLDVADRFGSEVLLDEEGGGPESSSSNGGGEEGTAGGSSSGGGPGKEADVEESAIKPQNEAKAPGEGRGKPNPPLIDEEIAEVKKYLEEDAKAFDNLDALPSDSPLPPSSDPDATQPTDPEAKAPTEPTAETQSDIPTSDIPKPGIAFFTPSVSIDSKYALSPAVWEEVLSTVKGTISLPKAAFSHAKIARTVDCVLTYPQTPDTNGTYFLDAVSEEVARELGATLIRIDAQDVAEIAGDYIETTVMNKKQPAAAAPSSSLGQLGHLGYDAQLVHPNNRPRIEEEEEAEEEQESEENEANEDGEAGSNDYDDSGSRPYTATGPQYTQGSSFPGFIGKFYLPNTVISIASIDGSTTDAAGRQGQSLGDGPDGVLSLGATTSQPEAHPKLQAVLELMLDSGTKKRETIEKSLTKNSASTSDNDSDSKSRNRTIVQVRDFKELQGLHDGKTFLRILRKLVYQRRLEGREIMILGNSATIGHGLYLSSAYLSALQVGPPQSSLAILERAIVVPPQPWDSTRELLERDRKARIREINMRHVKAMITRRSGEDSHAVVLEVPKDWHFENVPKVPSISEWVWDFESVHRLTLAILGSLPPPSPTEVGPRVIGPNDVAEAHKVIRRSDKTKLAWSSVEAKFVEERNMAEEDIPTAEEVRASNLAKLKGKCNKHEKRLLGGVIDPTSISTGFGQVRVAEETVDALKTLTSLSLRRPEAFSYGVLAQDKIPGVLLYGPPGTGKTLLAKAVAKESGATVLEVSGSEVYDMYVGEGEKNVKAIFSLAKKLSPCVVFIDEADAIFGARTAHHQRTSHRELINQFLKEWDGMAKMSAFIMVATNRPFDLDDAVLRRLPRRILVDLPTAADRLAIMQIHLTGEDLDHDVDLTAISSDERTNLYSGSDLKNVAVAAALAAVKEEDREFKDFGAYPTKRVLRAKHFEQALGEITASISDDMGSLGLIRKFDEKYGDRRGRKKKSARWGFGGVVGPADEVKERGTGRVRN